jgi:hypothetical protein
VFGHVQWVIMNRWSIAVVVLLTFTPITRATPPLPPEPAANPSLAELPHWPVGMMWPDELVAGWKLNRTPAAAKAEILVWIPPNAKRIRAALLIPNNSDSKHVGEHPKVREVLARHDAAAIYFRQLDGSVIERTDPPVATNTIPAICDAIARATGIAEFRHAPWVTFGKSSRGMFPYRMAWQYPGRVIATISYHGQTPSWPVPGWSPLQRETILHVNINGESEWDRTWYRHVRPELLNYRAHSGWLPHQVVVRGVGHGDYADASGSRGWGQPVPDATTSVLRVWDYIAVFLDKALELRLPKDPYPTDGPVALRPVDPGSGYLVHPRAVEECLGLKWRPLRQSGDVFTIVDHIKEPGEVFDPQPGQVEPGLLIRKASVVPEPERRGLFWMADRELVEAWLGLHNVRKIPVDPGD